MKKYFAVICFCFLFTFFLVPSTAYAGAVDSNGTCKGIKLWGKVQVVKSFPDLKVQVVKSSPLKNIKYPVAVCLNPSG